MIPTAAVAATLACWQTVGASQLEDLHYMLSTFEYELVMTGGTTGAFNRLKGDFKFQSYVTPDKDDPTLYFFEDLASVEADPASLGSMWTELKETRVVVAEPDSRFRKYDRGGDPADVKTILMVPSELDRLDFVSDQMDDISGHRADLVISEIADRNKI